MAVHSTLNMNSGSALKHGPQTTAGTGQKVLALLQTAYKRYAESRKAVADAKTLMEYDDHLLKDIGLNRCDIQRRVIGRGKW